MSPVVVLVGAPGAGKSAVGAVLAERLGVGLRETDADVEAAAGMSVSEIFFDLGEERFRALEAAAVRAALAEADGVLTIGGGAVVDPATRSALAGLRVVFLDVDLHDAVSRMGLSRDRPLSMPSPRSQLKRLLDARRPLYEEVATATVPTADRTVAEVAAQVIAALDIGAGQ